MKTLLIIDPQNDFITGTLTVPMAEEGMRHLIELMPTLEVENIVVTMDCHPIDHCSFQDQGGEWPPHCRKYDQGAAIYPPLFKELTKLVAAEKIKKITFIEKGTLKDLEEYSAFANGAPAVLLEADTIYVAGLAGDICVLNSMKDLISHGLRERLVVITKGAPSLDGGKKLSQFIERERLKQLDR